MTTDSLRKRKKKNSRKMGIQLSNLNQVYPQDLRQSLLEITNRVQRERRKHIKLIEIRTRKNSL